MADRTVPITELAATLPDAVLSGDPDDVRVSDIAHDSRRVTPGSLFVAVVGARFDGHEFIDGAVAAGAAAVAVQADRASHFGHLNVPRLIVPSTRAALAPLAVRLFGTPTRSLYLAGVTGTNGKTTTARLIDSLARAAGDRTGVIGTLGATIVGRDLPGDHTTPEAPDLQRLFAAMVDEGVTSAAMEVASHALSMGRTEGCAFDVGLFTNLTQDHLDYHRTMAAYRDAKARLFTEYADSAHTAGKSFTAVLADDETGRHYGDITRADRVLYYAPTRGPRTDIFVLGEPTLEVARIAYRAQTPAGVVDVVLPFGGGFNVANSLCAIGYGVARGLSQEIITAGLANCAPVPGRFQPVRAGQEFAVLVDYAHTPDGLENVLRSARPLTEGRLIAVFGCGGTRDRTKRPKMGRLAKDLADIAVVTSDNPRFEDPEAIIDDVVVGMNGNGALVERLSDRRAAIAYAIQQARPGDTVVIAGKGHENYQIVGDTTLPFDDTAVAAEEIRRHAL